MKRLTIIAACLVVGCAAQAKPPIKIEWSPTPEQWESVRNSGVPLNKPDGSFAYYLNATVINNLLTVKARLEEVSKLRTNLVIVQTDLPNAFSGIRGDGTKDFAVSTSLIDILGYDVDALAIVIAHEFGHLQLGHGGPGYAPGATDETDADAIGMRLAVAAGYDPCGQVRITSLTRDSRPLLSNHPTHRERNALANEYAKKQGKQGCQ